MLGGADWERKLAYENGSKTTSPPAEVEVACS